MMQLQFSLDVEFSGYKLDKKSCKLELSPVPADWCCKILLSLPMRLLCRKFLDFDEIALPSLPKLVFPGVENTNLWTLDAFVVLLD